MHTLMWTFKVPAGTSKAQRLIAATIDGGSLVGINLWESAAAAAAFHTADWVAGEAVSGRFYIGTTQR